MSELFVDAHVHAPSLGAVNMPWPQWAGEVGRRESWAQVYDSEGRVVPARLDEVFAADGVDRVLLFCEYSPKVTGMQPIEDIVPIVEHNPRRFRLVAGVNPHLHYPVRAEVARQLDLGAVALKIHPVHGGFPADDKALYPAFGLCGERGVPVIVHTGTSNFPGASARFGDPAAVDDVLRDFPELTVVLAHGGRGWWYDTAAFLAMSRPNVWIDIAGLPPHRLPDYYHRFDLERLARRFIFGTDWPGSPGAGRNATAVRDLGFSDPTVTAILGGNAAEVYPGLV